MPLTARRWGASPVRYLPGGRPHDFQNNMREQMRGMDSDPAMRQFIDDMTFVETFPIFGGVFAGPPGRTVWVRRGMGVGDALAPPASDDINDWTFRLYDLFAGDDYAYMGTVELPEDLTLMAGDSERVAGVHTDPLGRSFRTCAARRTTGGNRANAAGGPLGTLAAAGPGRSGVGMKPGRGAGARISTVSTRASGPRSPPRRTESHASSAPTRPKTALRGRFEDLYNPESKARNALERECEALPDTNRALGRRLVAGSDCREHPDQAARREGTGRAVPASADECDS
ncbi:MAG: hypothetical protein F4107_05030 [Gemmatimonadetes bacterium]|nr:hypothetical protein [Gemmatimonadota bacterium]MYI65294.1 hypothetical protein [Gemmatimonadota bacterium]